MQLFAADFYAAIMDHIAFDNVIRVVTLRAETGHNSLSHFPASSVATAVLLPVAVPTRRVWQSTPADVAGVAVVPPKPIIHPMAHSGGRPAR